MFLYMIGLGLRRSAAIWRNRSRGWGRAGANRPEVAASLLALCTAAVFLSHAYSYMLFALLGFAALAFRTFAAAPVAGPPPGWTGFEGLPTSGPGSFRSL